MIPVPTDISCITDDTYDEIAAFMREEELLAPHQGIDTLTVKVSAEKGVYIEDYTPKPIHDTA